MIFTEGYLLLFYALVPLACCQNESNTTKLPMSSPLPGLITSSSFDSRRKTVSILSSVNYGGTLFAMGPICSESIRLALDKIKQISHNLDKYELTVQPFDDLCTQAVGVGKFLAEMKRNDQTSDRLPLQLGPQCSAHQITGLLMPHFNFIGLSTMSLVEVIYMDRKRYRNYFPMTTRIVNGYLGLAELMKSLSWYRFAIISEANSPKVLYEKQMVEIMEATNRSAFLGVVQVPYVSGIGSDPIQIEIAVSDLAKMRPRIILLQTITPAVFGCFFHRYKLFGPNYVIFLLNVFIFSKNDPLRYPWCTEEMLAEVLESFIFFGLSNSLNINAQDAVDSTNTTGKEYEDDLYSKIDKPNSNRYWWFYRTMCYDNVLGGGYLLDATEGILQKRNQTLADWFVSGANFQDNGAEIMKTMKEALFSTTFTTLFSEVAFNNVTTYNSNGRTPIVFYQGPNRVPVAVYKTNKQNEGVGSLTFGPGVMKWKTYSGNPPRDDILVVSVLTPTISIELYSIVTIISVVVIIFCIVIAVHHYHFRNNPVVENSIPALSGFTLSGNVLLQCHTLVQSMWSGPQMATSCMVSYSLFFLGVGNVVLGMLAKLLLGKHVTASAAHHHQTPVHHHHESSTNEPSASLETLRKKIKCYFSQCMLFNVAYVAVLIGWFVTAPLKVQPQMISLEASNKDDSLYYQYFRYDCQLNAEHNDVNLGILIFLCGFIAIMAFRACMLALSLRSKRFGVPNDVKNTIFCLYGSVLLWACAALIAGAIFIGDQMKVRLTLTFASFTGAILNFAILFIPKIVAIIKPDDGANRRGAITATGHVTAHTHM